MSEYRERSNKRRDERQTITPRIRAPGGSKRNTKRWCKGVAGREHKTKCVSYNSLKGVTYGKKWKVLVCENCGKQLDHWWPNPWGSSTPAPPAWVADAP